MDYQILKTMGQIAGIGGLALGVFLLLFKDLLKKVAAPGLTKGQWFKVILVLMFLVWSIALAGVGAWLWVSLSQPRSTTPSGPSTIVNASNIAAVHSGSGNIYLTYGYTKEEYLALATNLAVTQASLDEFFKTMGLSNVPSSSVRQELLAFAAEYRALQTRIRTAPIRQPEDIPLQREALAALEKGNMQVARTLANKLAPPSNLRLIQ